MAERTHAGHLEECVGEAGFGVADSAAQGLGAACLRCCSVEAYAHHSGQVAAGYAAVLGFEAVAASDQLEMAVLVPGLVDVEMGLDR